MIPVESLIDKVQSYNPKTDAALIEKAYAFGRKMHEGQTRHSGEEYFTHPVEVACIAASQSLDDATIVTALLHDTVEDTKSTYRVIEKEFSKEIAELVDGVTKLTNLQLSSVETKQAENFRKLFLAMSRDLRVILVKLADRLHNMRTIRYMKPEKQIIKARETMDIYAPLAGRMGMQWMRDELEDLSFKVINPEARNSIMRRFITLRDQSGDVIPNILTDMRMVLKNAGIKAEIMGREKRPYSIWRKMEEKSLSFSRLSDIYGFRVITETQEDCYRALGAIHQRWTLVPGRFKDYISSPKTNGYRSLHTTVSGRDGKLVEVQVRTQEMHEVAEVGVAAHWSYRDGVQVENRFSVDPLEWLTTLSERFEEEDEDHEEFLEHVKLEMFADQVFCFTPKGDVVKLPRGATPVDFAYAIHTRIGNSCVGAKVDGSRVPLWTRLRNGQSVEVQTAIGQRPQASWIENVATGRAKSAIRRALKEENKASYMKLGQELTRVAFDHVGKRATNKALTTAAKKLGLASQDELLAMVGSTELTGQAVVEALFPALAKKSSKAEDTRPAVKIVGFGPGQMRKDTNCCQPLPGERIVGIATKGKGVEVHSISCPELQQFDDTSHRWIDLAWTEGSAEANNVVTFEVTMANYKGVLGRICTAISDQDANIADMEFLERKQDYFRIAIDVELSDVAHLDRVATAIEADTDVANVLQPRREQAM